MAAVGTREVISFAVAPFIVKEPPAVNPEPVFVPADNVTSEVYMALTCMVLLIVEPQDTSEVKNKYLVPTSKD